MNTHRTVTICPKCTEKRFIGSDKEDFCKPTYVPELLKDGTVIPEHLDIACRRCGYVWQEACADAK